MDELISVIVPVHNIRECLPRCLDSIIRQTYRNLEIILVDDGASDGSGSICDEYAGKDARIRVLHKQNQGVSNARNDGIKMAKGDFITFVDDESWKIFMPEDVDKSIDKRTSMGVLGNMDQYAKYQAAEAIRDAANNQNGMAGMGVGMGAGAAMGQMFANSMNPSAPQAPAAAAGAVCAACGAQIPAGAKFCPECGAKQNAGSFCTSCGTAIPAGTKFCPECGAKQ